MKINLPQILLVVYFLLSLVFLKTFSLLSVILFIIIALMDYFNVIKKEVKNLLYFLTALSLFPNLLYLFLIYLPFVVFGLILTKRSFIKSYVLGFAFSILPTIIIYTSSNYFNLPLNLFTISLIFYMPIVAVIPLFKKRKTLDFLQIDSKELFMMLMILFSTTFVAANIINNSSLFPSNGTYMYTRFELIVKNANSYNTFPIYDPSVSSGESPFLFETPLMFSHIAFANILLPFIPPVFFYNLYTFFILLLSVLSLSALIGSILRYSKRNWINITIITLGSIIVGLNFQFIQLLESFKGFFGFPVNYLLFSIILEKPKNLEEILTAAYLLLLTFVINVPYGVGIVLISFSLVFLILLELYRSKKLSLVIQWFVANKLKLVAALLILFMLPLFYVAPYFIFKGFLETANPEIYNAKFMPTAVDYVKTFFKNDHTLSLEYPDLNRIDDFRFGPFVSIFGLMSLIAVSFLYKLKKLSNFRLFFGAYLLHFLISILISNIPMIKSLDYTYRTLWPYLLILLGVSICAVIMMIKKSYLKLLLTAILLVGLLYALPLAKQNIENIHREEIISGKYFNSEIDFIKNLPEAGRIITYGLYANAIGPAMNSLTGKYFSHHNLAAFARERFIYLKIHGANSYGTKETIFALSGMELSNYLRLGGYKYAFVNICNPIGKFVVELIYPNFTYPLYQQQCLTVLGVNGTNYAEKVSVLEEVEEDIYKAGDGYKYMTLSKHYDFGEDIQYSKEIIEPVALEFKRFSPIDVEIYGDFEDNEWVLFKEGYFTRWEAYMDGKKIPVLSNNHNYVLINTIKGNTIKLRYRTLLSERLFGTLTLISSLLLLAWLLIKIGLGKEQDERP